MTEASLPCNPMLAGGFDRQTQLYPCYVQPKFDGIRCLMHRGIAWSRTLKPIPNGFVQNWAKRHEKELEGFDGELVVGSPTESKGFRRTESGIMSRDGEPDFVYWVFDKWNEKKSKYKQRYRLCFKAFHSPHLRVSPNYFVQEFAELESIEAMIVENGYEGIIIREDGEYFSGRSRSRTVRTLGMIKPGLGTLLKWKRFVDFEARIIGFKELMGNENEMTSDERGYAKRSSAKIGQVPRGTLGALIVQMSSGIVFNIGSGLGLDAELREKIWANQDRYLDKFVKVKSQNFGGYEKPRTPIFLGFRNEMDFEK